MRRNSISSTSRNCAGKSDVHRRLSAGAIRAFRRQVYSHYRSFGRHLPWRATLDPYKILVSEIMLQQTQVQRVIGKYRSFITAFPDFLALAQAPVSRVLRAWQGLGYNRRALLLHRAARQIVKEHAGKLPSSPESLARLPGVGCATAGALTAFAFNRPAVFIETNIRSVFLHHFFSASERVGDAGILPLIGQTLDTRNPRVWYWALMDYGVFLKKTQPNPSRRSRHYTRQLPFEGSDRQLRGAIVKLLLARRTIGLQECRALLACAPERFQRIVAGLCRDGLARKQKRYLALP